MTSQERERHERRSIRLDGYDYAEPGAYFVTICTQDHVCLFGQVVNGEMRMNEAGRMVQAVWDELPKHYPSVSIDAFVVLPNHIHAIIVLAPVGAGPRACPDLNPCAGPEGLGQQEGQPRGLPLRVAGRWKAHA
jgi:putative transposase